MQDITGLDIESIPKQPEEETIAEIAKNIQPPAALKAEKTIKEWHDGAGKYEGAKEKAIQETYLKTGLSGISGHICSIAWSEGLEKIDSLFATPDKLSEADMLSNFFDRMRVVQGNRPIYFGGHNIKKFDLPFLYQRAVILGVNPKINIGQAGRHPHDFFDSMEQWAGFNGYVAQDEIIEALGLDSSSPEDMNGSKVYEMWKKGEYKTIETYNRRDVEKFILMYKRLCFLA